MTQSTTYRGRLAPSPTGLLHLGHARTFWIAQQRAQTQAGTLVLRTEDLDRARCKPEFTTAMLEDLLWFGFHWQEGPDKGGPVGPYIQSERMALYQAALEQLRYAGAVYPCNCSRQDVLRALQAPHAGEDEPVYPGTCRPKTRRDHLTASPASLTPLQASYPALEEPSCTGVNWRLRVPDDEPISFIDGCYGPQRFIAGKDFGDFLVWRQDNLPSYQLAVVVDDAAMQITEVVRGEDLLKSTARQLLLYRALGLPAPRFYHCPLLKDSSGARLAKRHDALSLRALRAQGAKPEDLRRNWALGPHSAGGDQLMP